VLKTSETLESGGEKMKRKGFILVIVAVLAVSSLLPMVDAQPRVATAEYIKIIDAYYADLDGDSYEDDIKLLVEFSFTDSEPVRVDLNIWIELPSGFMYSFRVSVYRAPTESVLNIDCINMATESGWYTVSLLASVMGAGNGKLYITDELVFDPPTGGGGSLPPAVRAYF
jgi:hypothetical protein